MKTEKEYCILSTSVTVSRNGMEREAADALVFSACQLSSGMAGAPGRYIVR